MKLEREMAIADELPELSDQDLINALCKKVKSRRAKVMIGELQCRLKIPSYSE